MTELEEREIQIKMRPTANVSKPTVVDSEDYYHASFAVLTMSEGSATFPVPASLQDLERPPYNLLPYPENFNDDDEVARADSFDSLVDIIEGGNRILTNSTHVLFHTEEGDDPWNDNERIQAMYTVVR